MVALVFLLVGVFVADPARAAPMWGDDGHQIIGGIAQALLQPATAKAVKSILSGRDLPSVSTWADHIKGEPAYQWSEPLHFINLPAWQCYYDAVNNCVGDVCVAAAVLNYTRRLTTVTDPNQVTEALMFLTHFVGDLHQPLHVGFERDRGGNSIDGRFLGDNINLHAIWDYGLIQHRASSSFGGSMSKYRQHILDRISNEWSGDAAHWAECTSHNGACADDWATECAQVACEYAYVDSKGRNITNNFNLGDDYYTFVTDTLDRQLARAGVRLAAILNKNVGSRDRSKAPTWGPTGHQVTAAIAQQLLSSNAQDNVNSLLNGDSLADVADWADEVKTQAAYRWSAVLHYVDTPDWACNFKYDRDCLQDQCVVGAIFNYTSRLMKCTKWGDLNEALKFLVHFVGDVHQPLHVSFTSDEGGNLITGRYDDKHTNLHYIWDTSLIDDRLSKSFNDSQSDYTSWLLNQIQGPWYNESQNWARCTSPPCANTWAVESITYACSNAYVDSQGNKIVSGFDLGEDYYNFNYNVVDKRLAAAGVRLAATLNFIFSQSDLRSGCAVA